MTGDVAAWPLVAAAVLATYAWRGLGVLLSARIDPNGAVFLWITCVSYAMLAGLIARMTLMPLGGLAETPLSDRLIGMAVGFLVYFALRRRVLPGVAAGVGVFILLAWARQSGLL